MILGLAGRAGAGKDTVAARMQVLTGRPVVHASFAAPLKRSVAALFDMTVESVEQWKLADRAFIRGDALGGASGMNYPFAEYGAMTMREVLQRYGTEAHRDVFGDTFWVDQGIAAVVEAHARGDLVVFTDCRFDNEVDAIHDRGGFVFEVMGPEGLMDEHARHASERPPHHLDGFIANTDRREPATFKALDAQLDRILAALSA